MNGCIAVNKGGTARPSSFDRTGVFVFLKGGDGQWTMAGGGIADELERRISNGHCN